MADRGRTEVYAAEVAAFDGTDLETVRPFEDIERVVRTVTTGTWWPGATVSVVRARADAASSCARQREGHVEIRIAAPQATWATAAHELAHALAGVEAGHGPVFRRALLDVVDELANTAIGPRRGRVHTGHLAEAFATADLPVGARSWPAPDSGAPFAL